MANETHEQYLARKQRERERESGRQWPLMRDESNPDHWIYLMPTVEEVVAAGYQASYHQKVAEERAEMVRRFQTDPRWRSEFIQGMRAARAGGA